MPRKVVVRLKGGLGNQMFQYAAGFAMAEKNGFDLVLDTRTGFMRDRAYRRDFSLGSFCLRARCAKLAECLPFFMERALEKYLGRRHRMIQRRPWGFHINELDLHYHPELMSRFYDRNTWFDGLWQTESYFTKVADEIAAAFELRAPRKKQFLSMTERLVPDRAVAVGIRMYEEAPPGAHRAAPLTFYEKAGQELANALENPVFYLFCTERRLIDKKLTLPGEVRYITHDDGFTGQLNRLWALTQFRYHIISNSSFYWWGAWLAEKRMAGVRVYACDLFSNTDSIPNRWLRWSIDGAEK